MKKAVSILLAVLTVSICFIGCGKSVKERIAEQLELGNRYLEEMDYEQAIVAFNKVIEIDDKNLMAYEKIAEVYVAMGETDAADAILKQGYAATFTCRETYQEFSSLPESITLLIDETVSMLISGDMESLTRMSNDDFWEKKNLLPVIRDGYCWALYTYWNDYKLYIEYRYDDIEHISPTTSLYVELRPEVGTGYAGEVMSNESGYCSTDYAKGECVDWLWNGTIDILETEEGGFMSGPQRSQGTMHDSLRDGRFITKDNNKTIINDYENGQCVYRAYWYEDGDVDEDWYEPDENYVSTLFYIISKSARLQDLYW